MYRYTVLGFDAGENDFVPVLGENNMPLVFDDYLEACTSATILSGQYNNIFVVERDENGKHHVIIATFIGGKEWSG